LCEREPAILVLPLLQRFGVLGWGILGGLLLSGVFLLTQLLQSPGEMLSTPYGRLLMAKLLLVLGLFGLGALNKFHLVPAVAHSGAERLRQSIAVERVLALLVLVLTAALTTLTGPSHMG
jgi:putative copper export protein